MANQDAPPMGGAGKLDWAELRQAGVHPQSMVLGSVICWVGLGACGTHTAGQALPLTDCAGMLDWTELRSSWTCKVNWSAPLRHGTKALH